MNTRMYFLNILLMFSHVPIVQVCLFVFFFSNFEHTQTHTPLHHVRTLYHMSIKLNCLKLFMVHTALAQVILYL